MYSVYTYTEIYILRFYLLFNKNPIKKKNDNKQK